MPRNLRELLFELEAEMKATALWQAEPLPPSAYESTEPFCIDRMNFAQWLQFIFLPRMHALLDAEQPLPAQISIVPLAEVYFAQAGVKAEKLVKLLQRIEQAVLA